MGCLSGPFCKAPRPPMFDGAADLMDRPRAGPGRTALDQPRVRPAGRDGRIERVAVLSEGQAPVVAVAGVDQLPVGQVEGVDLTVNARAAPARSIRRPRSTRAATGRGGGHETLASRLSRNGAARDPPSCSGGPLSCSRRAGSRGTSSHGGRGTSAGERDRSQTGREHGFRGASWSACVEVRGGVRPAGGPRGSTRPGPSGKWGGGRRAQALALFRARESIQRSRHNFCA